MKRLFYMILLFTPLFSQGQDPSFSQFDLNMMYSNPAFAGYEGSTKPLLHSRNQWNGINENFNNSIFEISTNIKLNRNDRRSSTSWSPGIGVIKEDLVGINGTGNNVFINRMEFSLYPFTFFYLRCKVIYTYFYFLRSFVSANDKSVEIHHME